MFKKLLSWAWFIPFIFFSPFFVYSTDQFITPANVQIHSLPNGLQIILVQNHFAPVASCGILYKAGSLYDPLDKTGCAHFLEHLMNRGQVRSDNTAFASNNLLMEHVLLLHQLREKSVSKEYFQWQEWELPEEMHLSDTLIDDHILTLEQYLSSSSFSFTEQESILPIATYHHAAYTTKDYSLYTDDIPADLVHAWINIQAERMKSLYPVGFYKEKKVILEEESYYYGKPSWFHLIKQLNQNAFDRHPYAIPNIGWRKDIASLTVDDVMRFYHYYYSPQNAILCIIGDIDPESTLAAIELHFKEIVPSDIDLPFVHPPTISTGVEYISDAQFPSHYFALAYGVPERNHEDSVALDALKDFLTSGADSHLQSYVAKQELTWVKAGFFPGRFKPHLLAILGGVGNDKEVEGQVNKMADLLEHIPWNQFSGNSLMRIKQRNLMDFILADNNSGMMIQPVLEQAFYYNDPLAYWKYHSHYQALTAPELYRAAKNYFCASNRIIILADEKSSTP